MLINNSIATEFTQSAKIPLHAAKIREETKNLKYFQAYKVLDDTHFEPFVVEIGGELGVRVQEIFKKICNFITQSTGQSGSSIAYFWKSRLLVTLAKITHSNALRWAMAHNEPRNADSISIDFTDCYDDNTHETRQIIHSSGMECGSRRGGV